MQGLKRFVQDGYLGENETNVAIKATSVETIKEKAKRAQEKSLQVVVVCSNGEKLNGWITSYNDDGFLWEHPDGRMQAIKYSNVAEIYIWADDGEMVNSKVMTLELLI